MSEQQGGLSGATRHEAAAAIYAGGGAVNPDAVERVLALLARREAAAAAEAVEKALGDAADAWTQGQWSDVMLPKPTPPVVPVIAYSNRVGDWLRARADDLARGREEAGTVPQARGNGHESDEQTGAGSRGHRDATGPGERQQRNSGDEIQGDE